jgi:hypothetical protein
MLMNYQDFLSKSKLLGRNVYLGRLENEFSDGQAKDQLIDNLFSTLGQEVLSMMDTDYPFVVDVKNNGWQESGSFDGEELKVEAEIFPMSDGEFNTLKNALAIPEKEPDDFDFDGSMNIGSTVRFLNMVFEQNITELPDDDIKFNKTIKCSDGFVRTNFYHGTLYYQVEKDYS